MQASTQITAGRPPLLRVLDLSFTHRGQSQPTLRSINLTVSPGELVVLAGATGSGKSTLLNCLTGISPEHTGGTLSGTVLYQDASITDWSIRQRSQVMGILLQNVETQLFTDQVWEEVVFGLENWQVSPAAIAPLAQAALTEFELLPQQHWSLHRLSAGQKQRLLLACFGSQQPGLFLLDEPFAFLDTAGVQRLQQHLQARVHQGQAVLLIEHRLELVRDICDRAYYLEAGQLQTLDRTELPTQLPQPSPLLQQAARRSPALLGGPMNSPVDSPSILQTHQLSWGGYPPFPDLRIRTGDIVQLQGDNGSGKTTLLKLLSGLLPPTTGHLSLHGQDVTRQGAVQLARTIGFVLQNPNHQLFASTVEAEVLQPGVTTDDAAQLLAELNLHAWGDRHPQALSQGQKRRLALAAVLARRPLICLLDEIMVGQDAASLGLMIKALQRFIDQGGSLIFTSHDPGVVTVLEPRVITLARSDTAAG